MNQKALRAREAAPGTVRRRPVRLSGSRSKYGVRNDPEGKARRTVDGHLFASKAEAKRYSELKLLEKAGEIERLEVQRVFQLTVNYDPEWPEDADVIGNYVADFAYYDTKTKQLVVEDVKGFRTPLYKWKKKHCELQFGIQIREIRSGRRR